MRDTTPKVLNHPFPVLRGVEPPDDARYSEYGVKINNINKLFLNLLTNIIVKKVFATEEHREKFINSNRNKEIFGEEAVIKTTEGKKYEALILGIDKRFNYKLLILKSSFPDDTIKKMVKEQIEVNHVEVDIKRKVSQSLIDNLTYELLKKTAILIFHREFNLAKALKKGKIRIGYEEYAITVPARKANKICMRCGQLEHLKYRCKKKQRCLRCAGEHPSVGCRAPKKCINCEEDHATLSKKCQVRMSKRHAERVDCESEILSRWQMRRLNKSKNDVWSAMVDNICKQQYGRIERKIKQKANAEMSKRGLLYTLAKHKNNFIEFNSIFKITSINIQSLIPKLAEKTLFWLGFDL